MEHQEHPAAAEDAARCDLADAIWRPEMNYRRFRVRQLRVAVHVIFQTFLYLRHTTNYDLMLHCVHVRRFLAAFHCFLSQQAWAPTGSRKVGQLSFPGYVETCFWIAKDRRLISDRNHGMQLQYTGETQANYRPPHELSELMLLCNKFYAFEQSWSTGWLFTGKRWT